MGLNPGQTSLLSFQIPNSFLVEDRRLVHQVNSSRPVKCVQIGLLLQIQAKTGTTFYDTVRAPL